ncbi:hypothetical protein DDZ14_07325 [Maritimibacter sp. 55A14]|uniref:arylsulfotransferase family protein n=1 Tax=Maritimibacter sp. 55A14 TaxID=2174844 RepID=UPI000D61592F|nr:arylsulfotransferase family protein [Maritimibacter sp. 55A14]PWE32896.1 hypothetical protein DDZ14_07325 [Maritimibacter sp. 55A14]
MKYLFFGSILFLTAIGGIAYGVGIGVYRMWPYTELRFIKDELSFVLSDLMGRTDRLVLTDDSRSLPDLAPVEPAGLFGASVPRVSFPGPISGYTLVLGTFDLGTVEHAALLFDETGRVVHHWVLNEDAIATAERRDTPYKFPHGFEVMPDGSVIFAFDGGVSLQKFDACSRPVWAVEGAYHHSVTLTGDRRHVWTLINHDPVPEDPRDEARRAGAHKIGVADGSIDASFTVRDVIRANPTLDLFGARQMDETKHGYSWIRDPMHPNDIDPLPAALAGAFPDFAPGDLLMSFRGLNLVTAVDPETQKVKWYSYGQMRRQHDPDWEPDGTITIYDNRMHRNSSRIIQLRPPEPQHSETIIKGEDVEFYSWIQGKHQLTDGGNAVLFSIPQQGRVLEIDRDGNVRMELVNNFQRSNNRRFLVSEAKRLPVNYFHPGTFELCTKQ